MENINLHMQSLKITAALLGQNISAELQALMKSVVGNRNETKAYA